MMDRFELTRVAQKVGIGFICFLLVVGGYFVSLRVTGNFNTVLAGEFYRSGQMNRPQIAEYATRYGIKTIINLRGANAGSPWYDEEVAEARRLDIDHIDFKMSARRELTALQAAEIIALMKRAQKPILIHCDWGADRSGLVSALYLSAIKRSSMASAEKQLSIRFGHIPLPFIPEYAMDRSLAKLESTLKLSEPD